MPPAALRPNMYAMTSLEALTKRHATLPLAHIKEWKPFQIDALGLVTLLGADEVNQSVGTLQHRRYTEYLPLLAAFVIAGDRFVAEQPGFVLYNISDGITSTELKGWFTRWLMSQRVNSATTVLQWNACEHSKSLKDLVAPALSCALVLPLLAITVLIGDWYGVGNATAIIISILTRVYLLSQRRHARDTKAAALDDMKEENEVKTLCIIRSDGKMVTCEVPKSVLNTFVRDSTVHQPNSYHGARWLCWLALGVHMCILGMCTLFTQIYTVLLLVLSTWWFTSDFSWDIGRRQEENSEDESSIFTIPFNRDWYVKQTDHLKETSVGRKRVNRDKRQWAWARLNLSTPEEEAMRSWNLFPIDAKNEQWLQDYRDLKESLAGSDEKQPARPTSRTRNIHRAVSNTSSTMPLMEQDSKSATFGSSLNPNSASDISRASSPGNMPRVPSGG